MPAQYTRDQAWGWPPASSRLGEIHADFLERAGNPAAIAPERSPEIRRWIREERDAYARTWAHAAAAGPAAPLAAFLAAVVWAREHGPDR